MIYNRPDSLEVELVPRSKDDMERVELLERHVARHGYDRQIVEQLPSLLDWLADPNWEVARPIGLLLAKAGTCVEE